MIDAERLTALLSDIAAMQNPLADAARKRLAARHRDTILPLVLALHDAGIMGGERLERTPEGGCEGCGADLSQASAWVHGARSGGGWATLCLDCFAREGVGIGWGTGQLYRAVRGDEGHLRWFAIAGGHTGTE